MRSRIAPAVSRIACWPFVTEYRLHTARSFRRHMSLRALNHISLFVRYACTESNVHPADSSLRLSSNAGTRRGSGGSEFESIGDG